jgi:hypothetical protein
MAFVRGKRTFASGGGYYERYYLVETRREGGKVRQVVLAYLGGAKTVEGALSWARQELGWTLRELEDAGWSVSPQELSARLAGGGELRGETPEQDRLLRKLRRLDRRIEVYQRYADASRMPD